ncbi:MAG TPA: radical SAM protein [Prolixibacteraceae bacterium]|jgi:MoaA/NifB/PqqE/SkfB family radical SAM enzyme
MATSPNLITGWRTRIIRRRVQLFIIAQALKMYRNPLVAMSEMKRLRDLRNKAHGISFVSKYIKSGKQLYWNSDYCGFPSANLRSLIHSEFLRDGLNETKVSGESPKLQTLIWGITNRCHLSCQHCYEWDNISQTDKLSLEELKKILAIFKANGIRHLQFSGGEPLARFNDLVELTREASPNIDCWLLTSGFGLTMEKALALKKAGLKGVNISLDHWDEPLHNSFRNNEKSYQMVMDAVKNCLSASIIVSLSLCATREFVTQDNLMNYATLAKNIGAHFIRILEPRAAGKFAHQNVHLDKEQVALLSEFTIRLNTDPRFVDFPIISFFGYHQRKMGCFGAGNRYLYADPNGDVHACPFCRGKMGNLLDEPFNVILEKLKSMGCHEFKSQTSFTFN